MMIAIPALLSLAVCLPISNATDSAPPRQEAPSEKDVKRDAGADLVAFQELVAQLDDAVSKKDGAKATAARQEIMKGMLQVINHATPTGKKQVARQARRRVIRKSFGSAAEQDKSPAARKRKRNLLDEFEQTMVRDMSDD